MSDRVDYLYLHLYGGALEEEGTCCRCFGKVKHHLLLHPVGTMVTCIKPNDEPTDRCYQMN